MIKTFLIASTGDRLEGLITLLNSLNGHFLKGWKACVICQAYSLEDQPTVIDAVGNNGTVFFLPELVGAHSAKVYGLTHVHSDVWCSLDDDMYAIDKTNYDPVAKILDDNRYIGFVSCNWARTPELALKKEPDDCLVKQKLTFTGGGMLFRDDVAEIIRHIPNEQYEFDDCLWAMYAYVAGYINYRYFGSVAIHRICTKGGRRTWIKMHDDRVLPPPELLRVRRGKDAKGYNQYLICTDSDLTELSHQKHRENKKWA